MSATAHQPRLSLGLDEDDAAAPTRMAAMLRAVRLAEKCFEIARSTRFAGERASAISRGIAIAEKAGLRLDLFSIPGRDERHLQNALRDAEGTLTRWTEALRADAEETLYDAKRRAFDAATGAAADRDCASGRRPVGRRDWSDMRRADLLDRWPSVGAVLNALRARRIAVIADPDAPHRWFTELRHAETLDEWQLRELADEVCA